MVVKSIIQNDLPFSYVEYGKVRAVWKYLNPYVNFMCRNTTTSEVYKFYEKESANLKRELVNLPGRVSLTSDMWTSGTNEGYMCITAHYIDRSWKLNNKIIVFCAFPPPHVGSHIALTILQKLEEWKIDKKIFSLTLDYASNNDSMVGMVRNQLLLREDLVCTGEYFHVRCAAHVLNLIVQDGLAVTGDSLVKVRESIKFVQGSEHRALLFAESVEYVGINVKDGLLLDVKTRWNSTYMMLERALKYKDAFGNLQVIDRNYKFYPSDDEWKRIRNLRDLLQPFNEVSNLISGSTYPTSNLYFMQVWKIERWLTVNEHSEDEVVRKMVKPMKLKFDKYWNGVSELFAMTTVFDPRLKLTLAQFCYSELDDRSCQGKIEHLRLKLRILFESYENKVVLTLTSAEIRQTDQNGDDNEEDK